MRACEYYDNKDRRVTNEMNTKSRQLHHEKRTKNAILFLNLCLTNSSIFSFDFPGFGIPSPLILGLVSFPRNRPHRCVSGPGRGSSVAIVMQQGRSHPACSHSAGLSPPEEAILAIFVTAHFPNQIRVDGIMLATQRVDEITLRARKST